MKRKWQILGGLIALILFVPITSAFDLPSQEDDDMEFQEAEPWREISINLPHYPLQKDLLAVPIDKINTRFNFFIDTTSLNIGHDGIIRYTMVIESPSGSRNILHEGLHCVNAKYKLYAFGVADSKMQRLAKPDTWKPVTMLGSVRFRYELYRYFFCENGSPKIIVDIIRGLRHPRGEYTDIDEMTME